MSILAAESLHVSFGSRDLFDDASIAIEPRDRLGVVGPNGSGKSTLLKILAGHAEPDGGKLSRARGIRVGYLAQEHAVPGEGTLLDSVLSSAPGREEIAPRIPEVEAALAETQDTAEQIALSEELATLHARLSEVESQFGLHRAQSILAGLGFTETDFGRPVREFSGGWRMRGALAALLYQMPDVLLLDEPTNHLDLPSVSWLSAFLGTFPKALVLTCHDREFLNRHIQRVASLEIEGLRLFRGNYDEYQVQRELELEYLEAKQKKDEARRKELDAFVTRFKAKATKARQAQSKMRLIEKLQEEHVELPEVHRPVSIRFPPCARSGEIAIRVEALEYTYPGAAGALFSGLDLSVRRGDRISIVGVNGAGKTTLLRLIAGELTPQKGTINFGYNVTASYFAQHQAEVLRLDASVLEEVQRSVPDMSNTQTRTLCGAFLFSGDDVDKPIRVLSGGEKTRVALARMLARPGNLLLLDEPTNHLDTESADKLTASLETYDGTLLFVSHDLDFARRLSNKVWDVHAGHVETYPGSLGDYIRHLDEQLGITLADRPPAASEPAAVDDGSAGRETRKAEREQKRKAEAEQRKARSKIERQVAEVEGQIAAREKECAELESRLADPATHRNGDEARTLSARYSALKASLEADMERWAALHADLETLSERL